MMAHRDNQDPPVNSAYLEQTEMSDQLEPQEHQDCLEREVLLDLLDPLDRRVNRERTVNLGVLENLDRMETMVPQDQREQMEHLELVVHQARQDLPVMQAQWDPQDLLGHQEVLEIEVRREIEEVLGQVDSPVHQAIRDQKDPMVRPEVEDPLELLVRMVSRDQQDPPGTVELLDRSEDPDRGDNQELTEQQEVQDPKELQETLEVVALLDQLVNQETMVRQGLRDNKDPPGLRELQEALDLLDNQAPRVLLDPLVLQGLKGLLGTQGRLGLKEP